MGPNAMPAVVGGPARRGRAATGRGERLRSARSEATDQPLVVTGDLELLDGILAAAAAAGVEPTVSAEPASIRPMWATAPIVIIGSDCARQVADLVLPHRTEVYAVGPQSGLAELSGWSAPLGAAVVGLPDGAGLLAAAIADLSGRRSGSGQLVVVVGGSGGVGASSVAAALAVGAVSRGLPAMLIDLDALGGGIDLLVGAEGVAGWRWPRLGAIQGHLGDLTGHLPRIGGLDVLSTARDDETTGVQPEAVRAVLLSATRSHRLVVVDLPRSFPPGAHGVLRGAALTLLVVSADVRGIAAAQRVADSLRDIAPALAVVVRRPRSGAIESGLVAESLGLPLAGVLGSDASLRHGAERGDPPGRVARSPLGRLSRRILDQLVDEVAA
jgi:secretion/DNA translocation related CpaE-like protein